MTLHGSNPARRARTAWIYLLVPALCVALEPAPRASAADAGASPASPAPAASPALPAEPEVVDKGTGEHPIAVAITNRGKGVAWGFFDGKVRLWSRSTKKALWEVQEPTSPEYLGFAQDQTQVAVMLTGELGEQLHTSDHKPHALTFRDIRTGRVVREVDALGNEQISGEINGHFAVWSHVNSHPTTASVLDLDSSGPPRIVPLPEDQWHVAISADGHTIAAHALQSLTVLDVATGKERFKVTLPDEGKQSPAISEVALDASGSTLAMNLNDEVRYADIATRKLTNSVEMRIVGRMRFHPTSSQLAVMAAGGIGASTVSSTLITTPRTRNAYVLPGVMGWPSYSANGEHLVIAGYDGSLSIHDAPRTLTPPE